LQDIDLALSVARQGSLPGAEQLVQQLFGQALSMGNYTKAAEIAATSPGGILRGAATIQRLKQVPTAPGQTSPLLQYFGILLDNSKLNELESLELARPVLQQGKQALIEKWLEDDKV
jgi:clathrin heavy chain